MCIRTTAVEPIRSVPDSLHDFRDLLGTLSMAVELRDSIKAMKSVNALVKLYEQALLKETRNEY